MKKAFFIVFSSYYLLIIIGFTICAHYCGGSLDGLSLQLPITKKPCCGTEYENKGCCSEKEIHCQVKDVQNNSPAIQIPSVSSSFIHVILVAHIFIPESNETIAFFSLNHSPPDTSPPIHILNQTFRI